MLRYLVTVTEDLVMVFTLVSLMLSLCKVAFDLRGERVQFIGILVGLFASALMALAKNLTSKIATNQWNFYIFLITMILTLLFIVFSVIFGRKQQKVTVLGTLEKSRMSTGDWILCSLAAGLSALLIFYEVPDVMAYPFLFNTGGKGVLSMEYLVRLLGWLGALILIFVFARYLYRCAVRIGNRALLLGVLDVALFANGIRCFGMAISKWTARARWLRWLPTYNKAEFPWAFPIAVFVGNNIILFTFVILGIALLLPLVLLIRNLKVHGEWSNPAQKRKLRSIARQNRRWAIVVLVCFALIMLVMIVGRSYLDRPVTLSAPETYTVEDDEILIPVSQVNDGHLHRFEYVTEKKIAVRWIVVQKPNSTAFGVGLDACDVCGNAGYYERGDEIVCKRCDVVMNKNTIGFKGGCNPLPLAFELREGYLIFRLEDIIAGEKEFK